MDFKNICSKIKNNIYSMKKKRYFLPFSLIILSLIDPNCRNNTFLYIFIVFTSSLIILFNFPILVTWYNSKPLYYDELYVDSTKLPSLKLSEEKKRYYKTAYKIILTIYDSILIAVISNYWFFKTKSTSSYYEIIGITGGILQIFHVLYIFTGTIILNIIKYFINNTHKIAVINEDDVLNIINQNSEIEN